MIVDYYIPKKISDKSIIHSILRLIDDGINTKIAIKRELGIENEVAVEQAIHRYKKEGILDVVGRSGRTPIFRHKAISNYEKW